MSAAIGIVFQHHYHISSATLSQRLNTMDLDSYYHNRIILWAGHVARMPLTRALRQFLTGWVAHSSSNGCPEMTWRHGVGHQRRLLRKCKGLPVNFKEWRDIGEDRSEWKSRTYSQVTRGCRCNQQPFHSCQHISQLSAIDSGIRRRSRLKPLPLERHLLR